MGLAIFSLVLVGHILNIILKQLELRGKVIYKCFNKYTDKTMGKSDIGRKVGQTPSQ